MKLSHTSVLLAVAAFAAPACQPSCPADVCDEVPDEPWQPPYDDDDTDAGYSGSGYADDDDAVGDDDDSVGDDDDSAGDDDSVGDDDDSVGDDDDTVGDDDDDDDDDDTSGGGVVRDCVTHLDFDPPGAPSTVTAAGEWNAWNPAADALSDPDGDGVWSVDLTLAAGEYAFKYVIDGGWEGAPPADVYTHWHGTSENRNLIVEDCATPVFEILSAAATPAGSVELHAQFVRAADDEPIDPSTVQATVGGVSVTPTVDSSTGEVTVSAAGLAPGKHSVRLWAADTQGRRVEGEPLFLPLWVEDEPFEWRDATMYFVFTDRFRNGDFDAATPIFEPVPGVQDPANYAGGDFLGVVHAMENDDYFDELGANLLWLSPVYENPDQGYAGADGNQYSGYHGYWPILPTTPESRFGDVDAGAEDRLHELIDAAHARGIRVLFDLVLNHVHEDHQYVSQHPSWFPGGGCVCGDAGCGWDDHAIDCWFRDYLPDLNYRNHEIVQQITADVIEWAKEYDVDAFRVDAAKHMDHVIMRTLSMRLRDEFETPGGAPFYLVGETYTFTDGHGLIMDYVSDTELDGQFDFPLLWTLQSAFQGDTGFDALDGQVQTGEGWYGDAIMSPFLGNHDIPRYATTLAGNDGGPWGYTPDLMADGGTSVSQWDIINKMSMGFCFVLTQPGVPLIYYGDEIGMAGSGDPDNRRMMTFAPYLSGNQEELLGRVQQLGQLRRDTVALRRGDRQTLWVDGDFYVYARDAGGGEVAIVAMNKGGGQRTETITLPPSLSLAGGPLTDAIGGGTVSVSAGTISVTLDSWQYAVLLP